MKSRTELIVERLEIWWRSFTRSLQNIVLTLLVSGMVNRLAKLQNPQLIA